MKHKWLKWLLFLPIVLVAIVGGILLGTQSKDLINHQGMLTDKFGQPLNGPFSMVFSVYDGATVQTPLWSETRSVTVNKGIYSVRLGELTPLPNSLFNGADRYLGIKVGADAEMTPRSKLTSVPYSFNAQRVLGKKLQTGTATLSVSSSSFATVHITFPETFNTKPQVVTSGLSSLIGSETFLAATITNITVTGFDVTYRSLSGNPASGTATFDWTAVGD